MTQHFVNLWNIRYMQKKCYYPQKKNIVGSRFHQYEEDSSYFREKKNLTGFKKLMLEDGWKFFSSSPLWLLERQGDITRQLSFLSGVILLPVGVSMLRFLWKFFIQATKIEFYLLLITWLFLLSYTLSPANYYWMMSIY